MSRCGAFGLLVLGFACVWNLPAADSLTDAMSLVEVESALPKYPPTAANVDLRGMIAQSMDKLVHLTVKKDITDEQVAVLTPLRDFYLRQVDRGLQELEKSVVTSGVRIFKFYSSSVVIQSPEGVIAIDFQQGPRLTDCSNPENPDPVVQRTGFHWSPEQLDRLAKIVDVSLITHAHADHADYELSKRLTAQGKTVVVPQQLKNLWSNLGDHLVVPVYSTAQRFGPVEIFTTVGAQYMDGNTTTDANGLTIGHPSQNPAIEDAETVIYLAKIGDLTFLQAAENNVPIDQWLRDASAKGFRPDVKMSVGARQGARSVGDAFKDIGPVFFLPIHEYEMGHEGGGNRTAGYYSGGRRKATEKGAMMALFWGEDFAITPSMLSWRKADAHPQLTRQ